MATRPEKHQGGTQIHPLTLSVADQAACVGSATDAVQVVSISKSYGHRRHRVDALQDVTAGFARGSLTAVMGLSGCGKSTLLQCAAGLAKPTAGRVYIGGTDVTRLGRRKLSVFRRERVGFVFQALPVALVPAGGNVATGTAAEPFQAHGWASAALTPFRLAGGHAPVTASQIVLGSGVAASTGLRIGSAVWLAGQDLPAFTVVGVAAASGANPAGDWTVFVSDSQAASAVALGVSFVGANYLIDVTQTHGAVVQGGQRLVADAAVSAPGPGLAPAALPAIASRPGISAAVGLTPMIVFVPYPGSDSALAEAVTPGPLGAVLDLKVISGTLARFDPGDIALSKTCCSPRSPW